MKETHLKEALEAKRTFEALAEGLLLNNLIREYNVNGSVYSDGTFWLNMSYNTKNYDTFGFKCGENTSTDKPFVQETFDEFLSGLREIKDKALADMAEKLESARAKIIEKEALYNSLKDI